MENLAPPLVLLWDVKRAIENGQSVQAGLKVFLARPKINAFQYQTETWWLSLNNPNVMFNKKKLPVQRRLLLELMESGQRGAAIGPGLKSMEAELILRCEDEIQTHVARLPLLLLIPLLGLIFPAMLMLLILPILKLLPF